MRSDTIYALSSGLPPSGVAVVRLSGPQSRFVVETICGKIPVARKAVLSLFRDPKDGSLIDEGLLLWFPGPVSFTGEDVAEFQCHGGRAVVQALIGVLGKFDGVRMAERGEFTKRAFHNDKMDVIAVEGLADLIAAETEVQRRLAQRQIRGDISAIYDGWRVALIRARALLEAELDFSEEEGVPDSVSVAVSSEVAKLISELSAAIDKVRVAERIRDGVRVVLVGAPNAGKSSLMNVLAGRDVAIVSTEAGTTRDVIEVHLDLAGVPLCLSDTAGLRENAGAVEAIGIERAYDAITRSDIVVFLEEISINCDRTALADLKRHKILPACELEDKALITVGTKWDRVTHDDRHSIRDRYDLMLSSKTGEGIEDLIRQLSVRAADLVKGSESLIAIRARHREAIDSALGYLRACEELGKPLELRAEDLRLAADVIGRITGHIDVEDMLDVVFREFCIGK